MKKYCLPLLLALACNHPHVTLEPGYSGDQVTPEDVVWTQLVNATASGATLTKSGGQPYLDDAGAVSAQSIGGGDGWLEVTVADVQPYRLVGLARPHAGTSGDAIDFAFRLQAGRADVYESGAWKADNTVVAGDRLRIAVAGGIVTYSKNGNAVYTSALVPQYPLAAAASLVDAGAAIDGARVGIDAPTTGGDTFVSGVMAQPTAAGTGATVSWTTNVPTDGQVEYGTTTSYGTWSVYAAATSTSHSIALADLTPGTTYHYRVRAEDAGANFVESADATFTTPTVTPPPPPPPPSTNKHSLCGWLQATGWVPVEQDPGYLAFVAHAADFDAVHPMWYYLASTTTFQAAYGEGSPLVLANTTPGGKRTKLIPTIAAADGSQPQWASQMIHDATLRAQHEAAIVNLVTAKGYDGIDLDYEHLPDSDKAAFSVFAQELAAQLHARGKTLSFAVGGLVNAKYSHWDYEALSAVADQLHVMGYDYHYLGSHPGPVAPLGWIKEVLAYIDTVGGGARANKFVLGLPNYGLAGDDAGTTTWFGSSLDSINLVGGTYDVSTTHMSVCPLTNGETIAPGRAPNAMSASKGHVFFDDIASHEEKVAAAKAAGLAGITYWTIGGEPDRPGPKSFFEMIRSYFPE
jgi:chitinase